MSTTTAMSTLTTTSMATLTAASMTSLATTAVSSLAAAFITSSTSSTSSDFKVGSVSRQNSTGSQAGNAQQDNWESTHSV